MGADERDELQKREATMNRGRILTRTILLLIGVGLALSACVGEPVGYGPVGYGYDEVPYGWHDGWDYGHWDHGGWGHGLAHGHGGLGGLCGGRATWRACAGSAGLPRRGGGGRVRARAGGRPCRAHNA